MSAVSEVRLERAGHVATLIVDRPHRRNALARSTMGDLARVVRDLRDAPSEGIRAVVVTGGGGRFIAGGDLYDLADLRTAGEGEAMALQMQRVLGGLAELPLPVIAAIDAYALGGGAEVALACDLRVMAADAYIAFRQVALAVTTAWGAARRLRALVGPATARRLLWLGSSVSAEAALAMGLADEVAPAGTTALERALILAAELAERDPRAVAGLKAILRVEEARGEAETEAVERQIFGDAWGAEAHLQAVEGWLTRSRAVRED